jgi:ABC-type nitrate/sulfonate/bicarbonate transport system substrate-binding protein
MGDIIVVKTVFKAVALAAVMGLGTVTSAAAQDKVALGVFSFPSLSNTTGDLIKGKHLDTANGLDVSTVAFGSPGAEYAGLAKGEINLAVLSPFQLAKMQSDGLPVALYGTLIGLANIQVVTRNPEVKTFMDLKGRGLAATVAFSEYQYVEVYGRKMGLELRKDTNLVDATTALAQAQLAAGRVDAAVLWEPSATQAMRAMPDLRVILRGDDAWKAVSGGPGWDVVLSIDSNWAKAHGSVVPRIVKMYQDYQNVLMNTPDEADKIITSGEYVSKGLPAGSIAEAVRAKRLVADVHPSWDPATNKALWQILQIGVDYKEMAALPSRDAVINENPAK